MCFLRVFDGAFHESGAWKKNVYEYEQGRAVRECTEDHIEEKFKAMAKEGIEELMSYPCLFAYGCARELTELRKSLNARPVAITR